MARFLIFDPRDGTFVKMHRGGWSSGFEAEEVNSYSFYYEALQAMRLFESLKHCEVIEVQKTVTWCNSSTLAS